MIALMKTKHSQMFLDILKSGKAFNIAPNKCFVLKEIIKQSYDKDISIDVMNSFMKFENILKSGI